MRTTGKTTQRSLARAAVVSAVSSIELFNRPRAQDRISLSLIANVRAWEQVGKAFLLKKRENIFSSGDKTHSASKVIRLLASKYIAISPGESQTIHQIISLRDEATHSDLDFVSDDLAAHLLYFSLKSFRLFLQKYFPSYARNINSNFISINFQPAYTYSDQVHKMLNSRRGLKNNRLAFLLERGLHNAISERDLDQAAWTAKVRSLRGRRITKSTLLIKRYAKEHDNVIFITVEAPSKYGSADVTLSKGHHGSKVKVSIVPSDPEDTHPYLTGEIAKEIGFGRNIVMKAITELRLKGNKDYHLAIRSGRGNFVQRYSKNALKKIQAHLHT